MAMAASDIALLDTEGAPLRVYIKELKPTPQNNLEIVLHRRWVSPGWEVRDPVGAPPRARGPQAHHLELPQGQCGQGPAWRSLRLRVRAWAAAVMASWNGCGGADRDLDPRTAC